MKRLNSILKTILILTITIGIFFVIFTRIDFFSVLNILSKATPKYLFLAFLLTLISPILRAKRWQIILGAMSYTLPYWKCFTIVMGATPLAPITPSKSGELIKAYYLKDDIPITKTTGSIISERILDFCVLILFSLFGMIFCQRFGQALIAIILLIAIFVIILFFQSDYIHVHLRKSWNEKLQNLAYSMKTLTNEKKSLLLTVMWSSLIWLVAIVQVLMFFYALNIKIPLLFTIANVPIAIFVGLIPVTLGGMGTRDAAIIFLFSNCATPGELLSVGLLFSLYRYWLISLVGIPFMRRNLSKSIYSKS